MESRPHGEADLDKIVHRLVYDSFIQHATPVSKADLARQLSLPEEQIASSFGRHADAHMLVLQPGSGEVLMANPFSAVPTAFKVTSGSLEWWGNCIWDALGILAMTVRDGTIHTSCPDCGEALNLTVASGDLAPAGGIVHFSVPASRWWDDIVFT